MPARLPLQNRQRRTRAYPAYPTRRATPLEAVPALPADSLPSLDERDSDTATSWEAAEAFGTSTSDLRAEIRDEERQRHPGMRDDDDEAFAEDDVADELRWRMERRNR